MGTRFYEVELTVEVRAKDERSFIHRVGGRKGSELNCGMKKIATMTIPWRVEVCLALLERTTRGTAAC